MRLFSEWYSNYNVSTFSLLFPHLRGCAGHVTHRVCCLCPTAHARGCFRVWARAWLLLTGAHICTRLLLAGARGCSGQIARASVYLRSLYQKGHVKSKRMDEFYRTFIRSLSRLCCGGRKRGASARAKRRDKRRTGAVRNGAAQGITASGGEILTRTKPNRERMDNR